MSLFTRSSSYRRVAAVATVLLTLLLSFLLMRSPGRLSAQGVGNIRQWGLNSYGQSTPPAGNDYKAVSSGWNHSLAVLVGGNLAAWGDNSHGQCTVPAGNNFIAVAAGWNHSVALKADGSIAAWGDNTYGQATAPTGNCFTAVAAGQYHSMALAVNGTITVWGRDNYGQKTNAPKDASYKAIAAGFNHCVALKVGGTLAAWGDDSAHQCDLGTANTYKAVSAGQLHTIALQVDGTIKAWGANDFGQTNVPTTGGFSKISAGAAFNLALSAGGAITAWGDNSYGQLDFPAGTTFSDIAAGWYNGTGVRPACYARAWGEAPAGETTIPPGSDYVSMKAGDHWAVGLKADGSLVAWGSNSCGQTNVPSGNNFIAIAAGWYHGLALRSDGTIVGWGDNSAGQTAVPSPNNGFVAVAAGGQHSIGLKYTNQLVGWGWNYNHQASPPSGSIYTSIACGWNHSMATRVDGTAIAWGANDFGQCNTPAASNYRQLAGGDCHSLGLRADGTIVGWGSNAQGQLNVPSPNANFAQAGAGDYYSLALRSDGSLAAWGADNYYQTNVPAGNIYSSISAGHSFGLALCPDCSIVASVLGGGGTVSPAGQSKIAGETATVSITPEQGFEIDSITDNGVSMPIASPYQIPSVREDHDVVVTFAASSHAVNASVSGGGGTVAPAQQTVPDGATASITITPDGTHKIASITDNGVAMPLANPYVIADVKADHNVVVTFALNTFTVNASAPGGGGTVSPATQTVTVGGTASVQLTPGAHYHVASINDNNVAQTIANPYVITNVTADHNVVVTFAIDTYTVSASVSGGHGSVSPTTKSVAYGSSASITITPDAHYHVASITDNGAAQTIANPYVINNVTADHNVVVTFAIDTFTVNASVSGSGGTAGPATQTVSYGGTATVTMTPSAHYHVATITDNGVSQAVTSPYVISNVTANHTVVATFALDTYTVSASVSGGHGSVSPTTQTKSYGESASVTITPETGYHIATVTDNGTPQTPASPYVIANINADHTVVVTFAIDTFTVNATVSGAGGGVDPAQQTVAYGATATVTITPEAHYHVASITDNGVPQAIAAPYVINNVKADHAVVVTFELDRCTVTASVSGGHGSVSPTSTSVAYGGSASIAITPDDHYHTATITDNGTGVPDPLPNPYVVTNVTEDHEVVVTFTLDTFTVNASVSGGGGSVDPAQQTVAYGATATIALTPDATHKIGSITDNGIAVPDPLPNPYVITNVTGHHDVVVTYADNTRLVTASVDGTGGTVDPAQQRVVNGQDATIDITPDANHHISRITDNGVLRPIADPYVITDVEEDHAVVVSFAIDRHWVTASVTGGNGSVSPGVQSIVHDGTASIAITPDEGYHVATITDNGVPQALANPYVINNVIENHAVVVTFAIDTFTVNASAGAGGSVDPLTQTVDYGDTAQVLVQADGGPPQYHIGSIRDNGEAQPITDPHTMTYTIKDVQTDHAIEVTFATDTLTVTASAPLGHGVVSPATQDVSYGEGAEVALTPNEGCHVLAIRDNGAFVPVQSPYVIDSVTSHHEVVVFFAQNRYTVTAMAQGEGGTVTPDSQRVIWGEAAQVEITPDEGSHIVSITDNGTPQPVVAPYVIEDVTESHTVMVTFAHDTYPVNASVTGGHGTVSPASQDVNFGSPATVTLAPSTGYHAASITDNGTPMPVSDAYVIDSVTEQHDVVAAFAINTFNVTAAVSGGGGTATPAAQTVGYGSTARVTVTAFSGHRIAWIKDNGSPVAVSAPYTQAVDIKSVKGNHAVTAGFTADAPRVDAVSPESGEAGTRVTLTGECFGSSRGASGVTFNGVAATGYVSWSDGRIVVDVPLAATTGPVQVTTDAGGSNTDKTFTVLTPQWYLAEGSTAYGFDTYITIENPNHQQVTAVVEYMTAEGRRTRPDIPLPAMSQTVFDPRDDLGEMDFSTKVSCKEGKTIAVDRRMLWEAPGAASGEGHCSIGVSSPATTWYLPEGCSNYGFETWLLIQNPQTEPASCKVTYMIEGQGPVVREKTVPALSRSTYSMAEDIGPQNASILVDSNVPVIPERSMYRNNRREGHESIGTTAPSKSYYLAEGTTSWGFTTYVLVQNPNTRDANVTLTYMTDTGPVPQEPFTMPAQSRRTVRVNDTMPGRDFSTRVTADLPVIAERAMYWGADTLLGEACHDSIGLAAPQAVFYLPDGETKGGYETFTLVGNPNDTDVQVKISYLLPEANHVLSFTASVKANSRATFNMADKVESGRAAVMVESVTPGKKILVERSMYWNSRGAGTDTIGCT